MMFNRLKKVRGTFAVIRDMLKSVPVTAVDAETARTILDNITALDAAIEELDDAMVADVRAERYARTLPAPQDLTPEYLAIFAGTATTGELVA